MRTISEIDQAISDVRIAIGRLTAVETALQQTRKWVEWKGIESLPSCDLPIIEHRRLHRSGTVPKIEADAELQSFILARADRMTFQQIADDIAAHFPPERHVHRATVHRWLSRRTAAGRRCDDP